MSKVIGYYNWCDTVCSKCVEKKHIDVVAFTELTSASGESYQCDYCACTFGEDIEHECAIYRCENGSTTQRYQATVRHINYEDKTGLAVLHAELTDVLVPVFWGNVGGTFVWIEQSQSA